MPDVPSTDPRLGRLAAIKRALQARQPKQEFGGRTQPQLGQHEPPYANEKQQAARPPRV